MPTAEIAYEENIRVWVTGAIADPSAPTVAEITDDGVYVGHQVTKDGWDPGTNTNTIATGAIDTAYNAEIGGSWGHKLMLTFMRNDSGDPTDDVAHGEFTRRRRCFLVVQTEYPGHDITAADVVDVYPIEVLAQIPQKSAKDELQTFQVPLAVTSEPSLDAVVAA